MYIYGNVVVLCLYCMCICLTCTAVPIPVQSYIIARASKIFAQRTVGSPEIAALLETQEVMCRAYSIEYDTQQIDRSFFGFNQNGQYYTSYEPMNALRR